MLAVSADLVPLAERLIALCPTIEHVVILDEPGGATVYYRVSIASRVAIRGSAGGARPERLRGASSMRTRPRACASRPARQACPRASPTLIDRTTCTRFTSCRRMRVG